MLHGMTKENVCLLAQKLLLSIDPSPKENSPTAADTTQSLLPESHTSKKMVPLVKSATASLGDLVLELVHMIDTGGQPELINGSNAISHS